MVSTKHLFWKNEMQDAAYSKVIPNGKGSTLYYVNKILIDSSEYDLILFSLEALSPSNNIQRTLTIAPTELEEGEDIFVISSPLDLHGVISTGILEKFIINYSSSWF
jgi:hypothetical protein